METSPPPQSSAWVVCRQLFLIVHIHTMNEMGCRPVISASLLALVESLLVCSLFTVLKKKKRITNTITLPLANNMPS